MAFTPAWCRARAWLREWLAGLPVELPDDAAGNLWATLPGAREPPVTLRIVDRACEEGGQFGKSVFGSSACSGTLDLDQVRGLVDAAGVRLPEALFSEGIDFERIKDSVRELAPAAAKFELHIEQRPVLLDLDLPLCAVLGTFGVERHALTFRGQAAHSGSTPINRRRPYR